MIVTHLILPAGLAASAAASHTRGILQGRYVNSESLFAVLQGKGGEESTIDNDTSRFFSPASRRVLDHWAFSHENGEDSRLLFVVVNNGFERAFGLGYVKLATDISEWIEDGQPLHLESSPVSAWSLCLLERRPDMIVPHLLVCLPNGKVFRQSIDTVSATPELPSRMDGLLPLQALRTKRVALVGVGSGGSATALCLAAAGVGTLHLFDHDHLSSDNVFRHACDIRSVGRAKVLAMRDLITEYQLPTHVVPYEVNVVRNTTPLWKVMSEVDLVVCATDNRPSRRLINYLCLQTGVPLLLGCAFHNARIGEIIRVCPGHSACYECTRQYLRSIGALAPEDQEDVDADVPYSVQAGAANIVSENTGTRMDVGFVAHLLARASVQTLFQSTPQLEEADLPTNYFTWGVSATSDFPVPFAFSLPLSVNWMEIPRQGQCPACATIGEPYAPELEEEYARIMATVSSANQPAQAT